MCYIFQILVFRVILASKKIEKFFLFMEELNNMGIVCSLKDSYKIHLGPLHIIEVVF